MRKLLYYDANTLHTTYDHKDERATSLDEKILKRIRKDEY